VFDFCAQREQKATRPDYRAFEFCAQRRKFVWGGLRDAPRLLFVRFLRAARKILLGRFARRAQITVRSISARSAKIFLGRLVRRAQITVSLG
jgi:hypothetical protein